MIVFGSSGCISIAFAQEKWAERELAFAAQLAQLQSVVACNKAVDDNTSEAGDDLEEDEAWGKLDKGKRKSILKKAAAKRDEALASRLKAGLSKVSSNQSPFKKTST